MVVANSVCNSVHNHVAVVLAVMKRDVGPLWGVEDAKQSASGRVLRGR